MNNTDEDAGLRTDILPVAGCAGCTRVVLSGYLDLHTVPVFRAAMDKAFAAPGVRIILECQGLSFISAAGIGALVAISTEAGERGGELILAGIPEKSFKMFQLLGFSDYFIRANSSLAAIHYVKTTEVRGFPSAHACPQCGATLTVPAQGEYRCQACGACVVVGPGQSIPQTAGRSGTE